MIPFLPDLAGALTTLGAAVKGVRNRVVAVEEKPSSAPATVLHRYDPVGGAYNLRGPNTARLRAGIARARGGGAPVSAVVISDSLMLGTDGSTTDTAAAAPTGLGIALARAAGGDLQDTGLRFACGATDLPGLSWRASGTVTFAAVATMFQYGQLEHYDVNVEGDTVDVVWANVAGMSAMFDIIIDGQTAATVDPSGKAAGVQVQTVTGLALGPHRIQLAAYNNYVFVYGARVRTAASRAVVHNAAFGGSTAATSASAGPALSWTSTDPAVSTLRNARFDSLTAISATDPDLVVICLGTNDIYRSHDLAAVTAAITELRNRYPNSTVVLTGAWEVPGTNAAAWAAFRAARYTLADTLNIPFIDLAALTGDVGTSIAMGMVGADNTHPAHRLSTAWGRLLGQLLARESSDPMTIRRRTVASAPGAGPGWLMSLDLDYNTSDPAQPESVMVRVQDGIGTLIKTWWLNESGLPRAWAVRKDEPAEKLHAYTDNSNSPVFEVRGPWNQGATRRLGINSKGQFLLGPNQVPAGAVVTLAAGAAVPAGLPPGTLIVRTS